MITIKRHEAMVLSRRRRSDAGQKFSTAIFLSPLVGAKFIFFASFIISSHLVTMAIGSVNPGWRKNTPDSAFPRTLGKVLTF